MNNNQSPIEPHAPAVRRRSRPRSISRAVIAVFAVAVLGATVPWTPASAANEDLTFTDISWCETDAGNPISQTVGVLTTNANPAEPTPVLWAEFVHGSWAHLGGTFVATEWENTFQIPLGLTGRMMIISADGDELLFDTGIIQPCGPVGDAEPVEEDPVEEDPVEEDPVEEDPVEEDPVDPTKAFEIEFSTLADCLPGQDGGVDTQRIVALAVNGNPGAGIDLVAISSIDGQVQDTLAFTLVTDFQSTVYPPLGSTGRITIADTDGNIAVDTGDLKPCADPVVPEPEPEPESPTSPTEPQIPTEPQTPTEPLIPVADAAPVSFVTPSLTLPQTGTGSRAIAALATALMILGVTMVTTSRRRRPSDGESPTSIHP